MTRPPGGPAAAPVTAPLALALILALVLPGIGCGGGGRPTSAGSSPILVLAIDGLEPSILVPMARQGRLPHLAGLMARGRAGVLETLEPTLSPVIWTTVATGKPPAEHGITDFSRKDPATGEVRLLTSRDRRVPAVWTIASAGEREVDVVGWWNTWPAEPVHGHMVAQYSSPLGERRVAKGTVQADVPGMTWPAGLIDDLAPVIARVDEAWPDPSPDAWGAQGGREAWRAIFPSLPADASAYERRLVADSIWAFRSDAVYAAVGARLLRAGDSDLTLVYLGSPDVAGHRFFRHYRPRAYAHPPRAEATAAFSDVIPATYEFVDRLVGDLLDAAGPGVSVMVLADHGMAPVNVDKDFERAFDERPELRLAAVNAGHHLAGQPGAFIVAGPAFLGADAGAGALSDPGPGEPAAGSGGLPRLGSVFDVTPTLLHVLGLPVGADMPGHVLESLLSPAGPGSREVRFIDSYDPLQDSLAAPEFPGLDAERLRQLRSLGYIE